MITELYDDELRGPSHFYSKEEILRGDQLKIYQHYVPTLKLGMQKCPFYADNRESFSIHIRDGRIMFKDHGNGGSFSGDIFTFVKEWYSVFKQYDLTFNQVVRAIHFDMKLESGYTIDPNTFFHDDETGPRMHKNKQGDILIQVKDIGWTNWAFDYWMKWSNYNILEEYNTGHAKEVWVTKPGKATFLWGVSVKGNPIYYQHFPKTNHIKCYAPFRRGSKKWINNCNNETDIQGYHQLHIKERMPEIVIFTKANKECQFLRSMGMDGIAIHGEGHHYTADFIRHIRKYSKFQFSLYDHDWPGIKAASLLRTEHGIEPFMIQEAKNITDLMESDHRKLFHYVKLYHQLKNTL